MRDETSYIYTKWRRIKRKRKEKTKMNVLPTFLQEFIKSVVREIGKLADERLSIKRCVKFLYIYYFMIC